MTTPPTIKQNLRETFVTEMTKLILRSDRDGDMTIDAKESHVLALRLKVALQPHGVELDTDKFQRMINEDNRVPSILRFCGKVLYPEILSNKNDMESEESEYYDSDDEGDPLYAHLSEHGSKPVSFSAYCKSLSQLSEEQLHSLSSKMTHEEKMRMFTVNRQYSKGSVEVARGTRMSVVPHEQIRKKRFDRVSRIVGEAKKRSTVARKSVSKIENTVFEV